jgi:hypothetical protein
MITTNSEFGDRFYLLRTYVETERVAETSIGAMKMDTVRERTFAQRSRVGLPAISRAKYRPGLFIRAQSREMSAETATPPPEGSGVLV